MDRGQASREAAADKFAHVLRKADLKFLYSTGLRTMLESHFECVIRAGIETGPLYLPAAAPLGLRHISSPFVFFPCGAQAFDPQQKATRSSNVTKRLVKLSELVLRRARRSRALSTARLLLPFGSSSVGSVPRMCVLCAMRPRRGALQCKHVLGGFGKECRACSELCAHFQLVRCYAPH